MSHRSRSTLVALVVFTAISAPESQAQEPGQATWDSATPYRLLATRAELERVLQQSPGTGRLPSTGRVLRQEAERRLRDGDFRTGDLVLVEVQGEPTLSDTFAVDATGALTLPAPVVGTLSMHGVLRSEAASHLQTFVGRFLQEPVVHARALVRLSLEGEVTHAGFYAVPADATLSDAVMAAHGVTVNGDLGKVKVSRDGRTVLEGPAVRHAIARGLTIDAAHLRDGDQLSVGRGRGDIEGKLRFLWVVVSLAGGIYGLTRAL